MSKIEELEARLAEMQDELEKLKAEKAADAEWPQDGDEYWTVSWRGSVESNEWDNAILDGGAMSIGNVFRTEEEVEAEIEARKVIAELRRQAGVRRFVAGEDNWSVAYHHHTRTLIIYCWMDESPTQVSVWFDSLESAKAAIQAVGEDRIIKAARWWALGEC